MMIKARRNIIISGGLGLALAILAMLGWLTYRDIVAAGAAAQEVDHTYMVLQKLDEVFSALKDAETGQRGYVITGEKAYLEPYYRAVDEFNRRLSALRNLTKGNPRREKTLDVIELAMRKKLATLKEAVDIRGAKGQHAAMLLVETGLGEKLMDDIRGKVAQARDDETRLLAVRSAARETAARRLIGAILAGGGLSFTLLLATFFLLRKEIIRRIGVETELRRHQEGLEILVEERTRDLADANSRLRAEIAMRERAEEDLRKSMEDLARSNRALDQFASIASHDLQSPLRTVAGFMDLLKTRYAGRLDEKADEYIERAMSGTKRMSGLIHDLYVYSRVGTQGKQLTKVHVGTPLNAAIDNLREIIDDSNAEISRDELPDVKGDETQLIQLFQNLIANAIKFRKNDAPPRIRISAERRGGEWVIGVHDNGIGIEPRFYDRIFVIFQRLHESDKYPGTGLGLALCKKIVERHGGRIWVESRFGEGSSFYFTMAGGDE